MAAPITFIGSTTGSAINGGSVTLTLPGTYKQGNVVYVAVTLGTSRTPTISVASSSGGAYTNIVASQTSGNTRFAVFRQIITSTGGLTQAVTSGTGNSTDSTAVALMIFGAVELSTNPEDVTPTSTTGATTTPDSPSITVASCSCVIISAVGGGTVNALTAPSSFLQTTQASGSDTDPSRVAMAYVVNASTAAFNPANWTSTGVAFSWSAATIAIHPSIDFGGDFAAGPDSSPQVNEMRRVIVESYR